MTSGALAAGGLLLGLVVLELSGGTFGFYEDEGINLLKALMVARGHPLYREVFSDQAPLHTWLQAGLVGLFGGDLSLYRRVALLFGLALLAATSAVAAEIGGRWAALLCSVFMLAFAPVLKFATTIVITTPALALAIWSLFLGLRYTARPGREALMFGSGVLLGLACSVWPWSPRNASRRSSPAMTSRRPWTGRFERFDAFASRVAAEYVATHRLPTRIGPARRSCRFYRRQG